VFVDGGFKFSGNNFIYPEFQPDTDYEFKIQSGLTTDGVDIFEAIGVTVMYPPNGSY